MLATMQVLQSGKVAGCDMEYGQVGQCDMIKRHDEDCIWVRASLMIILANTCCVVVGLGNTLCADILIMPMPIV